MCVRLAGLKARSKWGAIICVDREFPEPATQIMLSYGIQCSDVAKREAGRNLARTARLLGKRIRNRTRPSCTPERSRPAAGLGRGQHLAVHDRTPTRFKCNQTDGQGCWLKQA